MFFKSYVVSLYMYEYFACMSMYHLHAWCLYCAEKIIESPGSGLQKVVNVHAGTGSCHFSSSWQIVLTFPFLPLLSFFWPPFPLLTRYHSVTPARLTSPSSCCKFSDCKCEVPHPASWKQELGILGDYLARRQTLYMYCLYCIKNSQEKM